MKRSHYTACSQFWKLCLVIGPLIIARPTAADMILFRDDFDGSSLRATEWENATGRGLAPTQFGNLPQVANGVLMIPFDTFNPDHPGAAFLGTEISTVREFSLCSGLEFEARFRVVQPIIGGLVISFFTYGHNSATDTSDEIDVELLTNWINTPERSNRVLLSSWNDFDETNPSPEQLVTTTIAVPNLNPSTYNSYRIRWRAGLVEWYVNDTRIFATTKVAPDDPMGIRISIRAPNQIFSDAFNPRLLPAASIDANARARCEIDYVAVTVLPPAAPDAMLDVDGNGAMDARTDGLLILRYMLGFRGLPLSTGAVGANCRRCTPDDIACYLESWAR